MIPINPDSVFRNPKSWVTRFAIDGKMFGGKYDALNDPRIDWFFRCFPNVQSVLELGSVEGGHTIALAKHPTINRVVGIEARQANIDKANMIKELYHASKVDFAQADLEQTDLSGLGQFDAVFCVGVLYHMSKPWELVRQIGRVARNLFVWTHYTARGRTTLEGFGGTIFRESGLKDPLSGLSSRSFWPTLESLREMLDANGFKNIFVIENNPNHSEGPAITLAATMENDHSFPSIVIQRAEAVSFAVGSVRKLRSWLGRVR